ncbi:hypothetical protein dsmv_0082 [Desulfococcus multivorans DSM 2059]|uniref:Uncharacterized protein n=2 Tax=Desulfococcaceae TaxID=2931039 RepID=S7TXL1_DESML|nr:hypothetical protein dsmv_0082 [Desulfococcus multivorans DSM 2059]SJZ88256.1 hypothetical protein SAMN02745446_01951 [Desulfococcus multivorans DSM 2059]
MNKRIKNLILTGIVGYAVYYVLTHHFIYIDNSFAVLPKSEITLNHTLFSPGNRKEILYKGIDSILENEDLREAGIGDLMVEKNLITSDELRNAEEALDYGG